MDCADVIVRLCELGAHQYLCNGSMGHSKILARVLNIDRSLEEA